MSFEFTTLDGIRQQKYTLFLLIGWIFLIFVYYKTNIAVVTDIFPFVAAFEELKFI